MNCVPDPSIAPITCPVYCAATRTEEEPLMMGAVRVEIVPDETVRAVMVAVEDINLETVPEDDVSVVL